MTKDEAEKIVADPFTDLALACTGIGLLTWVVFQLTVSLFADIVPWWIAVPILLVVASVLSIVLAIAKANTQKQRYEQAKRLLEADRLKSGDSST